MYDEIDLKHYGKVNFWTGAFAGFLIGTVGLLIGIGIADQLGYADKLFDLFGIK